LHGWTAELEEMEEGAASIEFIVLLSVSSFIACLLLFGFGRTSLRYSTRTGRCPTRAGMAAGVVGRAFIAAATATETGHVRFSSMVSDFRSTSTNVSISRTYRRHAAIG
jgi:hypothetical protein